MFPRDHGNSTEGAGKAESCKATKGTSPAKLLEPEVGQGSHHKGPHAFTVGVRIHLVGNENDTCSAKDNTSGKRSTRDKVPEKINLQ